MTEKMPEACLHILLLTTFLSLSAAHAEIYKWVDESGRVHYSEKKPETDKTPVVEMKILSRPSATTSRTAPVAMPSWQEQERQLKQRKAEEAIERASKRPEGPPRSLSGGRENGTDASRCTLARDILNGSLSHHNGAPIDKNDIDTAKSDVHAFCH